MKSHQHKEYGTEEKWGRQYTVPYHRVWWRETRKEELFLYDSRHEDTADAIKDKKIKKVRYIY